ncbi:MAG: PrgI family protein [Candidatus Pacebacteria bacterium]|nr:PrgI family protein [Candidatus Paceibacterota bacterium]MCF7857322.1 PrgI family protein [Candidatus Paceibacterota bacterium]
MRFEVPQFIEIEDKIIGPLTWRQFIYLAGGAGTLIVLYISLPFIFFVMFGVPLGVLSASLAFHRINNRPFSIFLESFINYTTKSKLYFWRKEQEQTISSKSSPQLPSEEASLPSQKRTLTALAHKLENPTAD